jgi:hypothetical protein
MKLRAPFAASQRKIGRTTEVSVILFETVFFEPIYRDPRDCRTEPLRSTMRKQSLSLNELVYLVLTDVSCSTTDAGSTAAGSMAGLVSSIHCGLSL